MQVYLTNAALMVNEEAKVVYWEQCVTASYAWLVIYKYLSQDFESQHITSFCHGMPFDLSQVSQNIQHKI